MSEQVSQRGPGIYLAALALFTFIVFSPAIHHQFTNWDDIALIETNPHIRSLDPQNIVSMFRQTDVGTYIPLSILSFAIEYQAVQLNPFLYHLNNVFLHILIVLLIFSLSRKLGLSDRASYFAALLFAVHPMHVEPVAWVTGRKDLLYSFFYLLAMHAHWDYLQKKRGYVWTVIFATLSILAKPMAYSLPAALLLLDWLARRPFSLRLWIEKIPHALIVVLVSLITFTTHVKYVSHTVWETVLIWIWNFSFHIKQIIWPLHFSPYYDMPYPVSLNQPEYLVAVGIFLLLVFLLLKFRNRWLITAVVFYLLSNVLIIFVRSTWEYGAGTVVADRFMYLSSLGFFILFGFLVDRFLSRFTTRAAIWAGNALIAALLIFLMMASIRQTQVWANSLTLWNEVIRYSPRNQDAYLNRAQYFSQIKNFVAAQADYDQAIRLNPQHAFSRFLRGHFYQEQGRKEEALQDYEEAIRLQPHEPKYYVYRGKLYIEKQDLKAAEADYSRAIELDSMDARSYYNRGLVRDGLKLPDQAIADYSRAIHLNPRYSQAYNNRGYDYLEKEEYDLAIRDFQKAIQSDPKNLSAQNNLEVARFLQSKKALEIK